MVTVHAVTVQSFHPASSRPVTGLRDGMLRATRRARGGAYLVASPEGERYIGRMLSLAGCVHLPNLKCNRPALTVTRVSPAAAA